MNRMNSIESSEVIFCTYLLTVALAGFALLGYTVMGVVEVRVACYEAAKVNPKVTCGEHK